MQDALFYLFAFISTLYVTHIGLYLIGANFYEYGSLDVFPPALTSCI